MADARPSKRPRSEADDQSPETADNGPICATSSGFRSRGDIWFEDGNVVLVAQDGTGFRVHQSILAANSDIFRDMFTIPQPEDREMVEGCPSYYFESRRITFEVLSAMLRLGSKYQIQHLRDDAVKRLGSIFPTSLVAFRNYFTNFGGFSNRKDADGCTSRNPFISIDMEHRDCLAMLNIAQRLQLDHMLPQIYYLLALLPNRDLVRGYEDNAGNYWRLSINELQIVLDGQVALRRRTALLLQFIQLRSPSPSCLAESFCTSILAT
ncbi:hypothetical protein BXZ70DRAFT_1017995 [Cristinia sonorae]|uniref:BTB domain-containing protein n=1 Tax=Cristinia sonorae TaxID=1940300 RepID=A0A8K0XRI7_9AGAR|nr:hypothetical protein BXZ70DRAFT_1017995 [Cristinia sonorae]